MMINDWVIRVIQPANKFGTDIYIFRRGEGNQTVVLQADGTLKDYPYSIDIPPTLTLEEAVYKKLVGVLCSDYTPPRLDFVEGKVEAQSEHLKDLRKLLKL